MTHINNNQAEFLLAQSHTSERILTSEYQIGSTFVGLFFNITYIWDKNLLFLHIFQTLHCRLHLGTRYLPQFVLYYPLRDMLLIFTNWFQNLMMELTTHSGLWEASHKHSTFGRRIKGHNPYLWMLFSLMSHCLGGVSLKVNTRTHQNPIYFLAHQIHFSMVLVLEHKRCTCRGCLYNRHTGSCEIPTVFWIKWFINCRKYRQSNVFNKYFLPF